MSNYEVGDIVEIHPVHPEKCMPGSPAIGLKGSIVKITKVVPFVYHQGRVFYNFKVLSYNKAMGYVLEGNEGTLNWTDEHFIPVKTKHDIAQNDVLTLFNV